MSRNEHVRMIIELRDYLCMFIKSYFFKWWSLIIIVARGEYADISKFH